MQKQIFLLVLLLTPLLSFGQLKLKLIDFATGFDRPVDIAHCDDNRLFIVEQDGLIWILDSLGNRSAEPFLDINADVNSTGNEQGLLGLAFHPDYAQNGWFFVYYIKNDGNTKVSRFSRDAQNPGLADPNSELTILEQAQPYSNHNGGCIKFGPDGYLYIGLGDGGSANDPQSNGQKTTTFLAKILRIDVNNSTAAIPYAVPSDNPFVSNTAYKPEIWATGLRNPWRYSFDRLTGDIWIGDVGQNAQEEIDFQPAGFGARNYGWRCYEGTLPKITTGCQSQSSYIGPVFSYANPSIGCSVTGGFVYRGAKYPSLYGLYLFTDYCSGRWWSVRHNADNTFTGTEIANLSDNEYSSLGEDRSGELYVAALASGKIQKVTELCANFAVNGTATSSLCADAQNGQIALNVVGAALPLTFIWSNGSTSKDQTNLGPGTYIVIAKDGNACQQVDTFTISNATPPLPTVDVSSGQAVLCGGGSVTLQASPAPAGYSYEWYNGDVLIPNITGATLVVDQTGLYSVRLVGICPVISESLLIDQEVSLAPNVSVAGDTLFGPPGWASYQWLFNNQPIAGATGISHIATQTGTYALGTISGNGCNYQSISVEIIIVNTTMPASVRLCTLTPNPTHDKILLTLDLQKSERCTISLVDLANRQIFSQTQQSQKIVLPIDLLNLAAGTYILHVQMESGSFMKKVVKL